MARIYNSRWWPILILAALMLGAMAGTIVFLDAVVAETSTPESTK